jgi:hypothetical protein
LSSANAVGEPYPNPASTLLNIPLQSDAREAGVIITTLDGRNLFEQNFPLTTGKGKLSVPIEKLPPGTYFLKLRLNSESVQRKFTKL